ncbi:MAG: hypothetical protein ACOYOK_10155 [Pseudobdellovibrionaceae bacterium]
MTSIRIFLVILFLSIRSFGADVGYTRSQTSSSNSNKVQASYAIDKQNKISLSAGLSKDTSGTVDDDKSSSFKIGYRYKTKASSTYAIDLKKSDESYNYEGQGLALKTSFKAYTRKISKTKNLNTKVSLKGEFQQKVYSLDKLEKLSSRAITIGADHDLTSNFVLGLDYTNYSYSSSSTSTKQALNDATITTTDISSYISNLVKDTASGYIEYSEDAWSLGLSYSLDRPYLDSGSKSNTTEIYTDIQLDDQWSINLSWSRGKTDGSTTNSDTTSYGFLYSF